MRIERARASDDYRIDAAVLDGYRQQLQTLSRDWNLKQPLALNRRPLPGVVNSSALGPSDLTDEWPLIKETLMAAMANMAVMRADEGRAMGADLAANVVLVAKELDAIEQRAPTWPNSIPRGLPSD